MGKKNVTHEETHPEGSNHLIRKLSCSLVGETQEIFIAPETFAFRLYGKKETFEKFQCSYGLNEDYKDELGNKGIKISGVDQSREVRIIELSDHRFFLATLFLPQISSTPVTPHPLLSGFLKAAEEFRDMQK